MTFRTLLFALCFSVPAMAQPASLSGHVLGHDGKPLAQAQVNVYRYGSDRPDSTFDLPSNGAFAISLWRPGFYKIQFNGLNHEQYVVPFSARSAQHEDIELKLGSTAAPSHIDSVVAIGTFNNFSLTSGMRRMTAKDGAYVLNAPFPSTRFEWQAVVCGDGLTPAQSPIGCPTKAEEFRIRNGHFTALQNVVMNPELRFDPSVLSASKTSASLSCGDKSFQDFCSTFASMTTYKSNYDETMKIDMDRHVRNGGNQSNFDMGNFNLKMKVAEQREALQAKIKDTKDSANLRLEYINLLSLMAGDMNDGPTLEKALSVIGPESDLWAIDPQLMYKALNLRERTAKDAYIKQVIAKNQNENVVVPIAYSELIQASVLGEKDRQQDLYKTITERFPYHPLTRAAKFYLNPNAAIMAGKTIPSFSYQIAGKDKKYTQESLRGKYSLLDLRTDHCSSCDQSARNLVGICHANVKSAIEIIALSLASEMPDVKDETKGKVSIVAAQFVKDGATDGPATFEYVGYPWRILIGPDLKILACGNDLNDEHFVNTLRATVK